MAQPSSAASPWWRAFPITSPFGDPNLVGGRRTRPAQHVDIATPSGTQGTPVEAGSVVSKGSDPRLGNYVVVRGKTGDWMYFHAAAVPVNVGDQVDLSSHLFTSGNTGASTGPHTSIRLIQGGQPVDPSAYLGLSGGPTMPNPNDEKPKPNVRPTAGPSSPLEDLLRRSGQVRTQGGGTEPVGRGGFVDPRIGPDVFGDPGAFFSQLVGESPTLAVMRAMARGGAPVFGGPAYLQDIAGQIANYTDLLNLLNVGTGGLTGEDSLAGSFGQLLSGAGGRGALNPAALQQLFQGILGASQGGSPLEQILGAQGGLGGEGTPEQQAQAGRLGQAQGAFESETGFPMGNILDFVLQDPNLVMGLLGTIGFGSGLAGKSLQKYFGNVVSPAYRAFQRELSPSASNPLAFLVQMLGGQVPASASGRSGIPTGTSPTGTDIPGAPAGGGPGPSGFSGGGAPGGFGAGGGGQDLFSRAGGIGGLLGGLGLPGTGFAAGKPSIFDLALRALAPGGTSGRYLPE